MLAEKVLYIADIMNRHEYVPKMPNQSEVDLIFDTSYIDVQPYLHRVFLQKSFSPFVFELFSFLNFLSLDILV